MESITLIYGCPNLMIHSPSFCICPSCFQHFQKNCYARHGAHPGHSTIRAYEETDRTLVKNKTTSIVVNFRQAIGKCIGSPAENFAKPRYLCIIEMLAGKKKSPVIFMNIGQRFAHVSYHSSA